jgi:hypothetical protein
MGASQMTASAIETTSFEWLRAYTALSRSGHVSAEIAACELAWGSEFAGNVAAAERVRDLPEYPQYAQAIRRALTFPLTLYRVTTAPDYETWRATRYSRPVATTVSLEFARLIKDVFPKSSELVLIKGSVADPEAVIMRGRIDGYEIVVDSGRIRTIDVSIIAAGTGTGL